ncbi:hypothetical protein HNQ80_003149 [Anaerosolibacter carboniphilus]|uniref:Uncharacterized protein n=1 Tax=Anaerosolibacter carboniphilus TaxID=1417629 RepID=A0A841KTL3_9FIRM|nr:hypothetical protein [Anaerosolibacter carboniphilus]MBB6217044.1 hypothetical protein [Anaerosolibacter carboniphilus]
MGFVNQSSVLASDSFGNIYSFLWSEEKIVLVYFDKILGSTEKTVLIENCSLEFDAVIDKDDTLYVACQKNDGSIVLLDYMNSTWHTSTLVEANSTKIYNLSIAAYEKAVHILYCVSSAESDRRYRIYHHLYEKQSWSTYEVEDIGRKEVLNPFQIYTEKDRLILCYYNQIKKEEQIFLKTFDTFNKKWGTGVQLTFGSNYKMYLDTLMTSKENFHLTYSEYVEGNLVVRYEGYKIKGSQVTKMTEEYVSNPANCSYPTFVYNDKKLWVVWTEYDQVVSSFTMDMGNTWSVPYLWKASKEQPFVRYKFLSNDENLKRNYLLNYSFGREFPAFSFIGFGSLDQATEIPLKSKKKEKDGSPSSIMSENLRGLKDILDSIEKKEVRESREVKEIGRQEAGSHAVQNTEIDQLKARMKEVEERIESIEEYLNRKRRGLLFAPRK